MAMDASARYASVDNRDLRERIGFEGTGDRFTGERMRQVTTGVNRKLHGMIERDSRAHFVGQSKRDGKRPGEGTESGKEREGDSGEEDWEA